MLRRDHELRLSDETQARYKRCGDDAEAKERVTAMVQRRVALDVGFSVPEATVGVELLQSAMSLFPDDLEMRNSAFYLYNNIHVPCPLRIGSLVPMSLPLHQLLSLSTRQCDLAEFVSKAPLTVLCAGSAT